MLEQDITPRQVERIPLDRRIQDRSVSLASRRAVMDPMEPESKKAPTEKLDKCFILLEPICGIEPQTY